MDEGTGTDRCDRCEIRLRDDALYCPNCGTPREGGDGLTCPACGMARPIVDDFCPGCGAHLGALDHAERRVITVLFADLCGFTRLTERFDPEEVHALAASCLEPLAQCATRWGGYVDKFIGDSVMALFGVPEGHENEPERGIRAALEMQETLRNWDPGGFGFELTEEVRPRLSIGVTTGPVVTGLYSAGETSDYTAVGDVVNVAARLESTCEPGEILVGEETFRATRTLFAFGEEQVFPVRGREKPVSARRVQGEHADPDAGRAVSGESVPLVDRRRELARLRDAWSDAEAGRTGALLVVGRPGIGKSRLVEELIAAEGLAEDRVARGPSRSLQVGDPWESASELVADLYGIAPDIGPGEAAAEVARRHASSWEEREVDALEVALSGDPAGGESDGGAEFARDGVVARAIGKALEGEGTTPKLLVLDDLQWADRTTLEHLPQLADAGRRRAGLLLGVTRPPLPGETALNALLESGMPRLEVSPLSATESRELLEGRFGELDHLPEPLVERLVARADGNPFFLEEIVASLDDRDRLVRGDEADAAHDIGVPDRVESVLSSRIDSLSATSKRTLQCASVVGRRFWGGALSEMLGDEFSVGDLGRLERAGFVHSVEPSRLPGESEYEFDSGFLRDVAYGGLLRNTRRRLHGRVAAWLERQPVEEGPEYQRLVARHRERSGDADGARRYREAGADG